jgi:hypothetical protein
MKKSFIKQVRDLADQKFSITTIANRLGKPVLEICEAIMLLDTLPPVKVKPVKVKPVKTPKQKIVVPKQPKRKKAVLSPFTPDVADQANAKRFIAKPYNENFLKSVVFDSLKEAVNYLNQFTETTMPAKDWAMVKKLMFVKSNGTLGVVQL